MPYRKFYSMRRRYNAFSAMKYKRRRQGISRYSLTLAKKALKRVNRNNKTKELKFVDLSFNSVNADAAGTLYTLNSTTVGTSSNEQRIGNKIYLSSFTIRGVLFLTANVTNAIFRVIIFQDKANTVDINEILKFYSGTTAPNTSVLSAYDRDTKLDFRVLYDKMYFLSEGKSLISGLKIRKKLKMVCQYNSSDTIQHNAIKMAIFANLSTAAANFPTYSFYSRVYYTDD